MIHQVVQILHSMWVELIFLNILLLHDFLRTECIVNTKI